MTCVDSSSIAVDMANPLWQVACIAMLPIFKALPSAWNASWIEYEISQASHSGEECSSILAWSIQHGRSSPRERPLNGTAT